MIEDRLKKLIVERLFLEIDPTEIKSDAPLEDYGVDSFFLMEIIVAIQDDFRVTFGQEDINSETLKSVNSIMKCIESKLQK